MYKFHEETNESHDAETNSGGNSDLLELSSIGLGAPFDQSDGIFDE